MFLLQEVEDAQFAEAEIDIPVETVVTKESPAVLLDDVCLLPGKFHTSENLNHCLIMD